MIMNCKLEGMGKQHPRILVEEFGITAKIKTLSG
jgi:hypothetical protein